MKPDCCTQTQTRTEFVMSKVRNMHTWLKPWMSAELQSMWGADGESKVMGLIVTGLLPLYTTGQLDEAVSELMSRLEGAPESALPAMRLKIQRYFECFCEALQA